MHQQRDNTEKLIRKINQYLIRLELHIL